MQVNLSDTVILNTPSGAQPASVPSLNDDNTTIFLYSKNIEMQF